jgi:hypothetical protein
MRIDKWCVEKVLTSGVALPLASLFLLPPEESQAIAEDSKSSPARPDFCDQ